jgi:hypothetical protein
LSRLDEEWARCSPWIQAALEYGDGTHELDDVKAEIDRGDAILWPGKTSAVVTQICVYPRKTLLTYWLAGGNLKELIGEMLPEIEAFARKAKFDGISVPGRNGWVRVLGRQGYRQMWSICSKEL